MITLKEALVKKNQRLGRSWPNPYNISEQDCIDEISGFPVEIVTLMLKCTEEQNPKEFKFRATGKSVLSYLQYPGPGGPFVGYKTQEGYEFWYEIMYKRDFSIFYDTYDKIKLKKRLKQ